jgi:hypothetical protein
MMSRAYAVVLLVVTSLAAGCASYNQLPDITHLPEKLLNKDEQQKKANEMAAKGQERPVDAAKEIEGTNK